MRARYLFGADGAASRVAADLGLDENNRWIVGVEDVYAARRTGGEPRFTCVVDPLLAPGYLAWVVNDGDEIHVGVGGYADRFEPKEALAAFTTRVARIEPLDGAVRLERRGGSSRSEASTPASQTAAARFWATPRGRRLR